MSSALIIFIGENIQFDSRSIIQTISNMSNIDHISIQDEISTKQNSSASALVCEYRYAHEKVNIRLNNRLDFIAAENLSDASLDFAIELQNSIDIPLTATDTSYSFLVKLEGISSVEEFKRLMISEVYME